MPNIRFSPFSLALGTVGVLAVTYIGLIAVIMSYAALTIEFAQSVRNDEAVVATLESKYLTAVAAVTTSDYAALGYTTPVAESFVRVTSATALR